MVKFYSFVECCYLERRKGYWEGILIYGAAFYIKEGKNWTREEWTKLSANRQEERIPLRDGNN